MHLRDDAPKLSFLVPAARYHRKHPTPSEALLWARLRGRALGPRFRRQHPFACGFIADFYCASHRLVIEVDGASHRGRQALDAARDAELARAHGVRVLRIAAWVVERDIDSAVARVRAALSPR